MLQTKKNFLDICQYLNNKGNAMAKRNFMGNQIGIDSLRDAASSVGLQVVSAEDFPFMFSVRPFRGAICALLASRGIRQGQRSVTFGGDGLSQIAAPPGEKSGRPRVIVLIRTGEDGKWIATITWSRWLHGRFALPFFAALCFYGGYSDLSGPGRFHGSGVGGLIFGAGAMVLFIILSAISTYRYRRDVRLCTRLLKELGLDGPLYMSAHK